MMPETSCQSAAVNIALSFWGFAYARTLHGQSDTIAACLQFPAVPEFGPFLRENKVWY